MITKVIFFLNGVLAFVAKCFADLMLLVIRLYWGYQFFLSGKGKLMNLDKVTEFFTSLNLPAPKFQAILAGSTECFRGLFLMAGLLSRLTAIPLIITMVVAYLTADREAANALFSKPDDFFGATPFLFLYASLIVFAFGPGRLSLDALLRLIFRKR